MDHASLPLEIRQRLEAQAICLQVDQMHLDLIWAIGDPYYSSVSNRHITATALHTLTQSLHANGLRIALSRMMNVTTEQIMTSWIALWQARGWRVQFVNNPYNPPLSGWRVTRI